MVHSAVVEPPLHIRFDFKVSERNVTKSHRELRQFATMLGILLLVLGFPVDDWNPLAKSASQLMASIDAEKPSWKRVLYFACLNAAFFAFGTICLKQVLWMVELNLRGLLVPLYFLKVKSYTSEASDGGGNVRFWLLTWALHLLLVAAYLVDGLGQFTTAVAFTVVAPRMWQMMSFSPLWKKQLFLAGWALIACPCLWVAYTATCVEDRSSQNWDSINFLVGARSVLVKDYYLLLGVPRNATRQDIRRAFRNISKNFHPDKTGGNIDGERQFAEISNVSNRVLVCAPDRLCVC
jgi:hypothetical protein